MWDPWCRLDAGWMRAQENWAGWMDDWDGRGLVAESERVSDIVGGRGPDPV